MIAYFKTEVPFLRLSIFFIAGLALSISFNLKSNFIWLVACGLLLAIISILSILYKRKKVYLNTYLSGFLLHVLLLILGIIFCNQHKEINFSNHFSKHPANQFIATILEEPKLKGDVARFTVAVKSNISNKKILLMHNCLLI